MTISCTRVSDERSFESCEGLLREYVQWNVDELRANYGVVSSDDDVANLHADFRAQLPLLWGERGRIYVAHVDAHVAGVAVLRPVDRTLGELKRVFVRPNYRGRGVGRHLVTLILRDASTLGYETIRLDSYRFMTAAHELYRTMGFVDAPAFENDEVSALGAADQRVYMELRLDTGPGPG